MGAKEIEPQEYVSTWDQLAEQLGTSRRTVANMMKLDGAPAKTSDGKYDVAEWLRFRERYIEESSTLQSLPKGTKEQLAQIRIRRDTAVAQREELLLAKLKGEVVPIDVVKAEWRGAYLRLLKRVHDMLESIPGLDHARVEELYDELMKDTYEDEVEDWDEASKTDF